MLKLHYNIWIFTELARKPIQYKVAIHNCMATADGCGVCSGILMGSETPTTSKQLNSPLIQKLLYILIYIYI